ncbi:hypothetical protein D3C78_1886020 [compost metagenome]
MCHQYFDYKIKTVKDDIKYMVLLGNKSWYNEYKENPDELWGEFGILWHYIEELELK